MNIRKIATAIVIDASLLLGYGVSTAQAGIIRGELVEVPPAAVGKILTKHGYKEGVIGSSRFRLERCFNYCDKLVTISVADSPVKEQMKLFMPKERLNMDFDLQATLALNPEKVDELFDKIPAEERNDGKYVIPLSKVYSTYAEQIVKAEAREFLSQFSINDIASNLEAVNSQLSQKLTESINKRTPFQVKYIGLANLQYPNIIVEAQENAAKRQENIRQEQAQLELSKVQLDRELQEAKMKRSIDVEKAQAEAAINEILGKTMTPQYVQYRQLEVLTQMANSQNKVFVPVRMLDTIAGQNLMSR